MPLPQAQAQHVDTLLTDLSVAFNQDESYFVADKVFPRVASPKQSNKYATFERADAFRDHMELRDDGSESAGQGYRVSTDSFYCDVFAAHIDVGDQAVAAADSAFEPASAAARTLVGWERIKREREFATDHFTTSIWTGGTSADPTAASLSAAWDNPASTPIEDLHEQANAILSNSGQLPNTLVLNYLGWTALKNHPDVVDRIKHTSAGPVTREILARYLFDDPNGRVLVSMGTRNTAQEGLTGSYSRILGSHALLVYSAPSPGLATVSGGYTFYWSEYPGSSDGRRIKRFRIEERASERVEIEATWDMKAVAPTCGVLIQSVAS